MHLGVDFWKSFHLGGDGDIDGKGDTSLRKFSKGLSLFFNENQSILDTFDTLDHVSPRGLVAPELRL